MKKILLGGFLLVPFLVFAQEGGQNGDAAQTPPSGGSPAGNIACFDYYKFGSVQADLQTNLAQTVPGATLSFSGKIVNENEYPLIDGKLSVKIFRRTETTFNAGNGNELVDMFTIGEDLTIPAKGEKEASFEWKVPMNARGGEYYAAYFFTTSERYNLMGLSFTDDVVGNQAQFTITNPNDPKTAYFLKNEATLNDQAHRFAAFPLHFSKDDKVTAKVKLQNPSEQIKTVPVQWNQYTWDSQRDGNRQNTKTELVTLQPNETRELTYQVLPTASSVIFVTVTAQDGESKSLLNIRYVRDGIEETRINFPSLTQFPIVAGQEQTIFACAHSTNAPVVKDNLLLLTLKDRDDQVITQYRYEGDISGSMGGFGTKFTSDKDYDFVKMEASLFRGGSEMEKVEVVYDCEKIDPNTCGNNDKSGGIFSNPKQLAIIAIAGIGILVLLIALIRRSTRRSSVKW